jgi:hypothetical protein
MEKMKPALLVAALAVLILASCTTIQNRRDLFSPQPVDGPYTRMLKDGSWRKQKMADTAVVPDSSANGSTASDSKKVMPPVAE